MYVVCINTYAHMFESNCKGPSDVEGTEESGWELMMDQRDGIKKKTWPLTLALKEWDATSQEYEHPTEIKNQTNKNPKTLPFQKGF